MTLPRSGENWSGFWGLAPFATEWRKGAFWGLAPFATEWRKGAFWGLAPFALLTHDSGSKREKGLLKDVLHNALQNSLLLCWSRLLLSSSRLKILSICRR